MNDGCVITIAPHPPSSATTTAAASAIRVMTLAILIPSAYTRCFIAFDLIIGFTIEGDPINIRLRRIERHRAIEIRPFVTTTPTPTTAAAKDLRFVAAQARRSRRERERLPEREGRRAAPAAGRDPERQGAAREAADRGPAPDRRGLARPRHRLPGLAPGGEQAARWGGGGLALVLAVALQERLREVGTSEAAGLRPAPLAVSDRRPAADDLPGTT